MKEINREIEATLRGMIEKRERAIENGETSGNDLLGLLLQSNMQSGKGSLRMSTEDVIEECKLFYFAGMETTSVLLTWTLVILSMHPEWQDRAREEVLSVFGRDKQPNFDGLGRLKTASVSLQYHACMHSFLQAHSTLYITLLTLSIPTCYCYPGDHDTI
jgi:cytochrome P450